MQCKFLVIRWESICKTTNIFKLWLFKAFSVIPLMCSKTVLAFVMTLLWIMEEIQPKIFYRKFWNKEKTKQPHMQWIFSFCNRKRWTKADGIIPSTGCIMQWSSWQVEETINGMILVCIFICHAWNEGLCWYLSAISLKPCFPSVLPLLICPSSQRWPGHFRESYYRLYNVLLLIATYANCSILLSLTIPSVPLK